MRTLTTSLNLRAVAWWPALAFVFALAVVRAIDLPGQFGSAFLAVGLGFVFVTVASFVVTFLVSRSFASTGSPALVLIGCGALSLGVGMVIASAADARGANFAVTIHNLCSLLAGICHLLGAVLSGRPGTLPGRSAVLTVCYGVTLLLIGMIVWATWQQQLPTFFIQGEGGTPLRQGVIITAAALFAFTALVLRITPRGPMPSFSHWYALGMILMSIGLFGVAFQSDTRSVFNWTARGAQYASGVYMLVAAVVSVRETRAWEVSLTSALMELRQRWEDLFALADDGIALYEVDEHDLPARIVQANPALARLIGVSHDKIQYWKFSQILSIDDLKALAEQYRDTPDGGSFRKEFWFLRDDGRQVAIEVSTRVFRTQGTRMGLSIIRDITERKAIERALRQTNSELQQFAYAVSHDLQESLRMVSIYTQLLERQSAQRLDPESRRHMERVVEGARRLNTLMKGLRSYLHAGDSQFAERRSANASSCLEEALATLRPAMDAVNGAVTARPLPWLNVAPVHLHQLFQNLIGNAIKFRGPNPPQVEIWAEQDGAFWRIAVRDNGIGIAPEFHDQVFGVFKRLHSQSVYEGSGIGLAICQKIVERYGGKIWIESALGAGATFWMTLPGCQADDEVPQGSMAAAISANSESESRNREAPMTPDN